MPRPRMPKTRPSVAPEKLRISQVLSFSGVRNGINGLINAQNLNTITVLLGMILIFPRLLRRIGASWIGRRA